MEVASHNLHSPIPYDRKIEWLGGNKLKQPPYIFIDVNTQSPSDFFLEVVVSQLAYEYTKSSDNILMATSTGCLNIYGEDINQLRFRTANVLVGLSTWKLTHDHYANNVYDMYDIDNDTMYEQKEIYRYNGHSGITLFWNPNVSSAYASPSHIHSLKFKDNTISLDLIPVRVGNEGFMYDRISGKMFGNSGSGSFVLGPDVEDEGL